MLDVNEVIGEQKRSRRQVEITPGCVVGDSYGATMTDDELEVGLSARSDQLRILGLEADRRLLDVARRLDNAGTRAALILSSAAIASAVQIAKGVSGWTLAATSASLIAAALAMPLLLFRPRRELNIKDKVQNIADWSPRRLELEILNVKTSLIDDEESALRIRSRLLTVALMSLAVAIVLTGIQIVQALAIVGR